MGTYIARYRRIGEVTFPRWTKLKDLIGHKWEQDQNKMVFFFKDGSVMEVAKWLDCEIKLGTDWVLWTKNNMERESQQNVKLNVEV